MAPPKCFFKRPEEFYSNIAVMMHPPKLECYSMLDSPNEVMSPLPLIKTEATVQSEIPLDLSCKFDSRNTDILKQLSTFLLQHQQQLTNLNTNISSNQYLNLERLFSQLPQQSRESNSFTKSALKSEFSSFERTPIIDRTPDKSRRHSPQSYSESGRGDNSSSETSSQYTGSMALNRSQKRKTESKVLRPFKLYKGNDSQAVMEALGINEEDEEWLRSIVEYKSVDDVFLFLTNCMNKSTIPSDLSDDVIEKIQAKFGHIFQTCNSTVSNPKMIRHPDMTPKELKTDEYWEKRRKNNDAAKRSREARRHKEDNLNQHCEKLQTENDFLRKEIELVKLRIDEIKRNIC